MQINHLEKFKSTIATGKTAIGAVITLSDMAVSECAGDCGLDFVWIDSEHGPHTLDTIKGHVTVCRGSAPMIRACSNPYWTSLLRASLSRWSIRLKKPRQRYRRAVILLSGPADAEYSEPRGMEKTIFLSISNSPIKSLL